MWAPATGRRSPDQANAEPAGEGALEVAVNIGGVAGLGVDVDPLAKRSRRAGAELHRCHRLVGGDGRLVEGDCMLATEVNTGSPAQTKLGERSCLAPECWSGLAEAADEGIVLDGRDLCIGVVQQIVAPVLEDELPQGSIAQSDHTGMG